MHASDGFSGASIYVKNDHDIGRTKTFAFQGLGLGSKLLDQLMDLTTKANLHWLKVEVNTELTNVIKAFLARGFEIRATFEDYFRDPEGATYDVLLMMRSLRG